VACALLATIALAISDAVAVALACWNEATACEGSSRSAVVRLICSMMLTDPPVPDRSLTVATLSDASVSPLRICVRVGRGVS
jgi:hypothetical protein